MQGHDPERVSPEAAEIFGYDAEALWAQAPGIRQVLKELVELSCPATCKVVPAGQNVRMDVTFLERGISRNAKYRNPFDYHVIDLATLFYSLVAGQPGRTDLRPLAAPGRDHCRSARRCGGTPRHGGYATHPGQLPPLHREPRAP